MPYSLTNYSSSSRICIVHHAMPLMRYLSLLRCEKMSLQSRSEAVGTPSRVPERVWKRVPFHRTRSGERPTTKCAATVSWNHQLVTVGRSKTLAAWDALRQRRNQFESIWLTNFSWYLTKLSYGGVLQWLARRSLAGSLIYARSMVDMWSLCG